MKLRLAIICFLSWVAAPGLASTPLNVSAQIEQQLHFDLQQYVAAQAANFGRRIEYSVNPPDPRLTLPLCNQSPLVEFDRNSFQARVSVKVSCQGEHPWSLYVPVQFQAWQQVAVAAGTLTRGQILSDADLIMTEVELTKLRYGFISEPDEAVGLELKRNLQAGEALYPGILTAPKVIQKGDEVIIVAHGAQMSVQVPGTAMNDGRMGEQINVRNTSSQRVIKATVIDVGIVRVNI